MAQAYFVKQTFERSVNRKALPNACWMYVYSIYITNLISIKN